MKEKQLSLWESLVFKTGCSPSLDILLAVPNPDKAVREDRFSLLWFPVPLLSIWPAFPSKFSSVFQSCLAGNKVIRSKALDSSCYSSWTVCALTEKNGYRKQELNSAHRQRRRAGGGLVSWRVALGWVEAASFRPGGLHLPRTQTVPDGPSWWGEGLSGGFCHYVALLHIAVHLNHWHGAWTSFLSLIIPAWDQIPFCLCVSGWTSMFVSWHYWICGTRYGQRGDWGHDRVCSVSDTSLYTSLKCVRT